MSKKWPCCLYSEWSHRGKLLRKTFFNIVMFGKLTTIENLWNSDQVLINKHIFRIDLDVFLRHSQCLLTKKCPNMVMINICRKIIKMCQGSLTEKSAVRVLFLKIFKSTRLLNDKLNETVTIVFILKLAAFFFFQRSIVSKNTKAIN